MTSWNSCYPDTISQEFQVIYYPNLSNSSGEWSSDEEIVERWPWLKNTPTKSHSLYFQIKNLFLEFKLVCIRVPDVAEVTNYLVTHSDMTELVEKMCFSVSSKFCKDSELTLEVYHDPEFEDDHLVLYIRKENYEDDIINKINDIEFTFLKLLAKVSGRLSITTDFQSPGG